MTTHELANLFDHLRAGLAAGMKAQTVQAFEEASAAFRELPDQPLRALVKSIQATPTASGKKGKPAIDLTCLIDQIRAVRAGGETPGEMSAALDRLNNNQLKEVLKSFDQKGTTKVEDNRARVRQLLTTRQTNRPEVPITNFTPAADPALVERGVDTYLRLRQEKGLSIAEVRIQFEPILHYPKPVVEEIARRLGYTPDGSREEIARRLLSNLEAIKMSQMRGELIMSGS
jgi:hypothetical protein